MLTNAERLELLKLIPNELSKEEKNKRFVALLNEHEKREDTALSNTTAANKVEVISKPCGTCGGGKVR